jgi:hypothetical protein
MLQFAKRVKRLASSMHGNLTSALFNLAQMNLEKERMVKKSRSNPIENGNMQMGVIKLLGKVDQ